MSKNEKKTTLFNKNHICIIKTDNVRNLSCDIKTTVTDSQTRIGKDAYVTEKCESPLGFYYYKRKYVRNKNGYHQITRTEITLPNRTYLITYMSYFEDKGISSEVRPWEIHPSDKPMAEHFINDLKNVIDSIIDDMSDYKSYFKNRVEEHRKKLYETFFGNKRGIRFQTDSEKILSHGFDLKISFRNRKEE